MVNIVEYKIRNRLAKDIEKRNLLVTPEVIDDVVKASLQIVAKAMDEERFLRLRQYQVAGKKEREMIQSIIQADENIGEMPHVILKHIKTYIKYFK